MSAEKAYQAEQDPLAQMQSSDTMKVGVRDPRRGCLLEIVLLSVHLYVRAGPQKSDSAKVLRTKATDLTLSLFFPVNRRVDCGNDGGKTE